MQQFILNMYKQSDSTLNRDRWSDLEMFKMGWFWRKIQRVVARFQTPLPPLALF
jgi:hypothetical protein